MTARAVGPLSLLAEYAAPLLRQGGVLVAWKGARDADEEAAGAAAAAELGMAVDEALLRQAVPVLREPPSARHAQDFAHAARLSRAGRGWRASARWAEAPRSERAAPWRAARLRAGSRGGLDNEHRRRTFVIHPPIPR